MSFHSGRTKTFLALIFPLALLKVLEIRRQSQLPGRQRPGIRDQQDNKKSPVNKSNKTKTVKGKEERKRGGRNALGVEGQRERNIWALVRKPEIPRPI